jgi:uncharacterized RDD family membrane protein YckC
MSVDVKSLRERYSVLSTEDLLELAEGKDLTPEATCVLHEELACRSDRTQIEAARALHREKAQQLEAGVRLPEGLTSVESDLSRYRTFWPRLGAAFLDSGALAPFQWIDQITWNMTSSISILLIWSLFQFIVFLVYSIGFVAKFGQTPGKMACGVKIVALDDSRVSLQQAILRHIVGVFTGLYFLIIQVGNIFTGQLANRAYGSYQTLLWVGGIFMFWGIMEFATMLTNKRRRAIHDFIAGTVIIRDTERKNTGLLWILVTLLILSFIIPHIIPETNLVMRQ